MKHYASAFVLVPLLVLANTSAHSQENAHGFISSGLDASDDSDGFREFKPWAQYESSKGWGVRAGWQRYSLQSWTTTGRSISLTHHYQAQHWNSQARLGLSRTAGHQHLVGLWDAMHQFNRSTAAGWSIERDVVNSQRGLQQGLTSTTALAVLDHQFNDRWVVGLAAGSSWFSDDNRRDMVRSRWTLTLHEDQGIYTYVITRHYRNSRPYQGAYFAPERFREAAWGLLWKTALTDKLIISANADWGRQYIDGQGQRLWHWGLYLSAPHRAPLQWKLGISTSRDNSSSSGGGETSYRYTSFVANLKIPF